VGVDAFAALWSVLPGWRWLARLVRLPGIGWVAALAYDRIAAPLLYRAHLRRQARRQSSDKTAA
jgi:predicted DCC family thiol-disulfide oxidoreductase YuxK